MMCMRQILIPTPRTLVVDFLRNPFGGVPLGGIGWTVSQIADGTGLPWQQVRRTLRGPMFARRDVSIDGERFELWELAS